MNICFYFPRQNLEKISAITSSVTVSPVIFPNSSKISFKCVDIISIGILFIIVILAFSKFSLEFNIIFLCLTLVTIVSPSFAISFNLKRLDISLYKASTPSFVFVDISTIGLQYDSNSFKSTFLSKSILFNKYR